MWASTPHHRQQAGALWQRHGALQFGTHMDPLDPMPTKHLWRYGGAITMGGVPGASPLVAAGGRAYYVSYGWLYCLGTTAGSPASVSVKSDPAGATNPMPLTLDEIRAELNSQVSQIVAAGHLGPTARFVQPPNVLLRGASTPFLTFWHDGELVRAVAEALPYLDAASQAAARTYLRSEVSNYLLDDSDYEYRQESLSYAGITTTWWADNEYLVAERLYALYAYAHYTDDWDLIDDNWAFIRGLFMDRFSAKYSASLGFCQFESWHIGDLLDLNRQMGAAIAVSHMAAEVGDSATAARADLMLSGMSAARVRLAHTVRDLYDSGDLSSVVIRLGSDGRLNNSDIMTYYNNPNETVPYREYRDRTPISARWCGGMAPTTSNSIRHGPRPYAVMVGYSPLYPEVAELCTRTAGRDPGIRKHLPGQRPLVVAGRLEPQQGGGWGASVRDAAAFLLHLSDQGLRVGGISRRVAPPVAPVLFRQRLP